MFSEPIAFAGFFRSTSAIPHPSIANIPAMIPDIITDRDEKGFLLFLHTDLYIIIISRNGNRNLHVYEW